MKRVSISKNTTPRILLIGVGRFGVNHLRILKSLDDEGSIRFAGAVIRNSARRKSIKVDFGIKTYDRISNSLLKNIDAVDIVTPPESHFELVAKCLKHCDVFVEKPLAERESEAVYLNKLAEKYKRNLAVGHIFRYHPVALRLKKILHKKNLPVKINGSFINPISTDQGRESSMELLHLFDIVDYIWRRIPISVFSSDQERLRLIDIRYAKGCDARFVVGWDGDEKIRKMSFKYDNLKIEADFIINEILLTKGSKKIKHNCTSKHEPLYLELRDFVASIKGKGKKYIEGKTGARIVSIAGRTVPKRNKLPSVAVIGGGIFGACVATELGESCSVTMFEKNSDLMQEGTLINQFRHHRGYHYPRSDETVYDIQKSRLDFEEVFKDAIVEEYPTYYGLSKKGSYVSVKELLTFCKKHTLPYIKEFPAQDLLEKKEIALSIRVPEPSYHHGRLKSIVKTRLAESPNIRVLYNTPIIGCSLDHDGRKTVSYKDKNGKKMRRDFDFVVNATYASINHFANWLGFKKYPLRVDLAEVLIVKLSIQPVSITVIDGPFATLMPTGNPNEFTLYHVRESIIDRYVPSDGLVKKTWKSKKSNQEAIFNESLKLFPILKKASIIESRIVHRGVQAYHEHDDSRVADIVENGFGCWSILSGKIISSVTTAKRLAKIIQSTLIKNSDKAS